MKRWIDQFREDEAKAWDEHEERFTCSHSEQELCRRELRDGRFEYVRQCRRCGAVTSSPVKKSVALETCSGREPPSLDEHLSECWECAEREAAEALTLQFKAEYNERYQDYLESPEWDKLRSAVLKRARGLCEGCLERSATQVHHITYADVGGAEFAFDLLALCRLCHDRFHGRSKAGAPR